MSHFTYGLFTNYDDQGMGYCVHKFTLTDPTSSQERQACDDVFKEHNVKQFEGHIVKIGEDGWVYDKINSNEF